MICYFCNNHIDLNNQPNCENNNLITCQNCKCDYQSFQQELYCIYIPISKYIEIWTYINSIDRESELIKIIYTEQQKDSCEYKKIIDLNNNWVLSKSLPLLIKSINKLLPFI